nr:hypothetical protein [Brevibacillus laterosporus]
MIPSKILNPDGIGLILSEEEETTASTEETATATASTEAIATATATTATTATRHFLHLLIVSYCICNRK